MFKIWQLKTTLYTLDMSWERQTWVGIPTVCPWSLRLTEVAPPPVCWGFHCVLTEKLPHQEGDQESQGHWWTTHWLLWVKHGTPSENDRHTLCWWSALKERCPSATQYIMFFVPDVARFINTHNQVGGITLFIPGVGMARQGTCASTHWGELHMGYICLAFGAAASPLCTSPHARWDYKTLRKQLDGLCMNTWPKTGQ